MTITHYSFGKIVIGGKTYNSDQLISCGKNINSWNFDYNSHQIEASNLTNEINENIKEIIIGIGYNSSASLANDSIELLESMKAKGMIIHVLSTSKAVEMFNSLDKKGLLAFFHLNC